MTYGELRPPLRRSSALSTASSVQLATGHRREFAPLPIDPVLAGAIKAFVATGYHGASMRSIAQFANMSVPGVYHHYPSKQDLLVKILDITMTDLHWRLQRARDDGNDPVERVALVVEALALFHTRRSDLSFIAVDGSWRRGAMRQPRSRDLAAKAHSCRIASKTRFG